MTIDFPKSRFAVILQARTGSTRLPGKVLADLGGRPLIQFLVERLKRCSLVDQIILATTTEQSDNELAHLGGLLGLTVVRASSENVLARFALAAEYSDASAFIRITGDCPFVDPELLDEMITEFINSDSDYFSNCVPPSYPDGLDIEIFTREVLIRANNEVSDDFQREHVTPWMRVPANCRVKSKTYASDFSAIRVTVDEVEDLEVVRNVVRYFKGSSDFSWLDVVRLYQSFGELFMPNHKFKRNEGSRMNQGQKLWERAKRVIPGGNMLLSKRSEMFLPKYWPSYFSQARGCRVWDLEGREFIDMSTMGVGTNLLGYSHPIVDQAVHDTVTKGNMSTLNCPEEVWLAEKLIDMHPWSGMARFARSGGEANAIAIRIARAETGRDTVAICGYHGWHDWYLATNLESHNQLQEHLLPGLEPNGVPSSLAGTVQPFSYNNYEQLEEIASRSDLAAVKMEVQRTIPPEPGFLEKVRDLCTRKGIVLIFDECTSGFRETYGGLHLKYDVNPDMAVFGKALGNGYAITAVLGRSSIMQSAQSTFISSTFWTERIGPTAALKTLDVMKDNLSWETVSSTGSTLRKSWQQIANKYDLKLNHKGLDALCGFSFASEDTLKYKTLITQEMLKQGFLASTNCYLSVAHTPEIINRYLEALSKVFSLISDCENGRDINSLLDGPVCHTGFTRLN